MKSEIEPRSSLFVRAAGLSDRVDYRLMETDKEKDQPNQNDDRRALPKSQPSCARRG